MTRQLISYRSTLLSNDVQLKQKIQFCYSFVCFGGYESFCLKIEVGYSQGSVLGLMLFVLYIDILLNSTSLSFLNFVGDTILYKIFIIILYNIKILLYILLLYDINIEIFFEAW